MSNSERDLVVDRTVAKLKGGSTSCVSCDHLVLLHTKCQAGVFHCTKGKSGFPVKIVDDAFPAGRDGFINHANRLKLLIAARSYMDTLHLRCREFEHKLSGSFFSYDRREVLEKINEGIYASGTTPAHKYHRSIVKRIGEAVKHEKDDPELAKWIDDHIE